jgi:hypothetical protein
MTGIIDGSQDVEIIGVIFAHQDEEGTAPFCSVVGID